MKRKIPQQVSDFEPSLKRKKIENFQTYLSSLIINPFTNNLFSSRYRNLLDHRTQLPIFPALDKFRDLYHKYRCILLIGATGSGKTTQLPQAVLHILQNDPNYQNGQVCVTQPRRVAAMTVAQRVSEELDVTLGEEVGFSVRFFDCTSPRTKLKFLTDGMLLRETMRDPLLKNYHTIVLDEVHERTVQTDLLLGYIKKLLQEGRKDLRVIVMSATLDTEGFRQYFPQAPLIKIPGRTFPVQILYTPNPVTDYFQAAIKTVIQIHVCEPLGDILCFLTGEEEIHEACATVKKKCESQRLRKKIVCFPLHASLEQNRQLEVFRKLPDPNARKVIFATNIAETSLTIDGISYVVDPGFVKQKVYHPRARVESLLVTEISRASANQRAGRAGRTRQGKCYRLYPERAFHHSLKAYTHPEIVRTNLCSVVLSLLKMGVENLVKFDFFDAPAPETMMRALEELHHLGAIDGRGKMTGDGELMSMFPVSPNFSKCIITACRGYLSEDNNLVRMSCSLDVITIVSMLSVSVVFLRPRGRRDEADRAKMQFRHSLGDHLTLLNVFNAYMQQNPSERIQWCHQNYLNHRSLFHSVNIRKQLIRICENVGLEVVSCSSRPSSHGEEILKAFLSGFFIQVGLCRDKGEYFTVRNSGKGAEQKVSIHPSSAIVKNVPKWIVFNEFVLTSRNFVRTVSVIQKEWLKGVCSSYYNNTNFKNAPWFWKKKVKKL